MAASSPAPGAIVESIVGAENITRELANDEGDSSTNYSSAKDTFDKLYVNPVETASEARVFGQRALGKRDASLFNPCLNTACESAVFR